MLWGAGHTFTTIIIGLLIAGLSLSISESFFLSAEILVGVMLIMLGILTVTNKSTLMREHNHPHKHANGVSQPILMYIIQNTHMDINHIS